MNKKFLFFLALFIIGIAIFIYFYLNNTNNNENTYTADKTSVSQENNTSQNKDISENQSENSNTDLTSTPPPEYKEEQLSTFSTKIYSQDSARQNNIQITCNSLNGTTVKNGETFSFCNTVGQATSTKGYQKAEIFDKDGNKKKGLRWR